MPLRLFLIPPSAMLTDHLPHGDGLVGLGFIEELARRGHEVHVAAGGLDLRRRLPQNVHLHRLGDPAAGGLAGRLRHMARIRALYGRLKREAPFDVAHQLNPVDVGVSLALARERVPVVLGPYIPDWAASGAGADPEARAVALRAKAALRAAQQKRAVAVLLTTPAAAPKVSARAVRDGLAVHELPHGIDDSHWRPGSHEPNGQDVLFLSNLEVRKGIHVLLDAFERISAELPAARLLIGGDGPERQAVEARVRQSPGLARAELLGRVERERVLGAMQACDAFCLPSYGEPYGMAALEAMACARPVVATRAGGLGHLVPDDGGRKVAPGDAAALAAALREVLSDPARRSEMGRRNREAVERGFAWSRVGDRLEQVYAEAISARR